jgi:general secretion pathway protein D
VATTMRSAVTSVVVRDLDTIAMGGLMRDKETVVINKVPLLGDIPILGWLFKNQTKAFQKTNLLMFMTPRILSPYEKTVPASLKDLTNRRSAHLKGFLPTGDAFSGTMKGVYDKAVDQENGALFDPSYNKTYQDINAEMPKEEEELDLPDYNKIKEEVEASKKDKI